jgi:hypothetical protein
MFGAFDIDSLQFETRLLLRRIRILTGESEDDAIRRALEERYLRLISPAITQNLARRNERGRARSGRERDDLSLRRRSARLSAQGRTPSASAFAPHTCQLAARSGSSNARCEVVCKRRSRRLASPSAPRTNFSRLLPLGCAHAPADGVRPVAPVGERA